MKALEGKVALVTGAAGTMGLAAAKFLLEDGCRVAMVDFNRERNTALARELGAAAQAFSFDISDPEAVRTGHESIVDAMGDVDILVNNAGILSNNKVEATDAAEWRRVLGANLDGAFYLALERWGYDISDGHAAVRAFQRRWRPHKLDGEIDGEISAMLFELLLDRDSGKTR